MSYRAHSRVGIGRLAVVGVVIVIVATATGIVALGGSQNSISSTAAQSLQTSSAASSLSSSTAAGSTSAATSTTATISCPSTSMSSAPDSPTLNMAALFGNFSRLALSFKANSSDESASGTVSYAVLGRPVANSTVFYKVQINSTISGLPDSSLIAWYTPTGNATVVQQNGQNSTVASFALLTPTLFLSLYYVFNQELPVFIDPAHLSMVKQSTVTLGPTSMTVGYYQPKSVPYTLTACGQNTTIDRLLLAYGTLPGTKTTVVTYVSIQSTSDSTTTDFTFEVTSIQKA